MFQLHPRLAADALALAEWPLSRVLLMDEARYLWLVLVPRVDSARELHDLSPFEGALLMQEISRGSRTLAQLDGTAKVNVGALGNLVPQLHVHLVARAPGDPAWPGPVWGHSALQRCDPATLAARIGLLRATFGA